MYNDILSNIVESVSKLLQVTGFTPPTKKSAVSLVTFTKTNSLLAQIDRFATLKGKNIATNNSANFYYIGPRVTLDSFSTLEFYAGKKLVSNISIQVDLDNQEYQIPDKDVDIRTVLVSVDGTYWTNYTNEPIVGTNEDSEIFFIVKKGDYYYIKFGKNLQSEDINSIGKEITSDNSVLISYVISSGEAGNNVKFTSLTEFSSSWSVAGATPSPLSWQYYIYESETQNGTYTQVFTFNLPFELRTVDLFTTSLTGAETFIDG